MRIIRVVLWLTKITTAAQFQRINKLPLCSLQQGCTSIKKTFNILKRDSFVLEESKETVRHNYRMRHLMSLIRGGEVVFLKPITIIQ